MYIFQRLFSYVYSVSDISHFIGPVHIFYSTSSVSAAATPHLLGHPPSSFSPQWTLCIISVFSFCFFTFYHSPCLVRVSISLRATGLCQVHFLLCARLLGHTVRSRLNYLSFLCLSLVWLFFSAVANFPSFIRYISFPYFLHRGRFYSFVLLFLFCCSSFTCLFLRFSCHFHSPRLHSFFLRPCPQHFRHYCVHFTSCSRSADKDFDILVLSSLPPPLPPHMPPASTGDPQALVCRMTFTVPWSPYPLYHVLIFIQYRPLLCGIGPHSYPQPESYTSGISCVFPCFHILRQGLSHSFLLHPSHFIPLWPPSGHRSYFFSYQAHSIPSLSLQLFGLPLLAFFFYPRFYSDLLCSSWLPSVLFLTFFSIPRPSYTHLRPATPFLPISAALRGPWLFFPTLQHPLY